LVLITTWLPGLIFRPSLGLVERSEDGEVATGAGDEQGEDQ
jgi:hypothetical protein